VLYINESNLISELLIPYGTDDVRFYGFRQTLAYAWVSPSSYAQL